MRLSFIMVKEPISASFVKRWFETTIKQYFLVEMYSVLQFFLRLNYLDMHRTYGCSANPHRTWPLCDFCGKKFCQPQKLKIHIKRMHNDISEVLKEFQCKSCLKVLGSRAALQRHLKEVHNKQIEGSCACYRCGKLFQNKSNLKIHMLTHSGIKPFRCKEDKCNAAFTTKQCLQFHYKKTHGFTEEVMPKIERSVDYTFEAYSGMENMENEHKDFTTPDNSFDCDNDDNEENEDSIGEQNVDDPGDIELEASLHDEPVQQLIQTPPPPNQPESLFTMKILSKGSKKWLGEQLDSLNPSSLETNPLKTVDKSSFVCSKPQNFEVAKVTLGLNAFGRHESSNASLLVEAALGSVADINCNDSNIDIDVSGTPNSTDALVSNICTLPNTDELPDVPYSGSVDVTEHRNIGLISPSVNGNISVTDDLNTELHNDENVGIDYSSFQEGDFSSNNSPENEEHNGFRCDYTNGNRTAPQEDNNYDTDQSKNLSPGSSPPRYNFGNEVTICHVSPNNANCITAQNLSVHDSKGELDLSVYKSSYGLETSTFHSRKDLKMKLSLEPDHKQLYVLEVEDISRNLNKSIFNEDGKYGLFSADAAQVDVVEPRDSENKTINENTSDEKYANSDLDLPFRSKYSDSELDTRNKQLEFDLNFRSKSYDLASDLLQIRSGYENNLDLDFRNKNYPSLDNADLRNKTYDNIDTELRADRNFESLVFTPADLQGIDMTARSFHNYHASSAAAASLNRYHHLYSDVERATIDLRMNYSPPPPPPTYSHSDVLRVVSLDLTSPGRHTVDLSLRSNPLHAHQIPNTRLLTEHNLPSSRLLSESGRISLDQNRLLTTDLSSSRHLETHSRLLNVSEQNNRVLSDHSTNRLLSNDQSDSSHFGTVEQARMIADDTRYLNDQSRLIEPGRLLSDVRILPTVPNGSLSPIPYPNYSVSPTPYHPPVLTARPHVTSPTPSPYHHYSSYY
ncbi:uncharacterized protein LOC108742446 isoform X2 [Agrilus planipennis]|uniref:Uncharacterized protein LOC108742446 isoform X2 n=1 Tax=Agrilus planipennis TaxID=224129 RepID=A0A7F5R755_AGRPL|nr:uncharacterized protein LOC108742446 isoform X2 [Agrilus planipennis]